RCASDPPDPLAPLGGEGWGDGKPCLVTPPAPRYSLEPRAEPSPPPSPWKGEGVRRADQPGGVRGVAPEARTDAFPTPSPLAGEGGGGGNWLRGAPGGPSTGSGRTDAFRPLPSLP